jgi:hypothetical protein
MSELLPDLTSPAAALSQQARLEARVEAVLLSQLGRFLDAVLVETLASRRYTSPSFYADEWAVHLGAPALAKRLPSEVAEYVAVTLAESPTPDEAWSSAMAVLTRSSEQAWSATDEEVALRAALSMEGGETFLTAAAPVVKRDEDGKPIYRRTAALDEGGISWVARMRRDARTAITGLYGNLSTEQMRQAGMPTKMWVTRRDERVRDAHAAADGQAVPINQPFIIDGFAMEYPGDRNAPTYLTVNCRCVTTSPGGQFAQQDMGEFSGPLDMAPSSYWDMAANGETFTRAVNPGWFLDPDNPMYNANCARVVQAIELRARGWNVKALPVPGGNLDADLNALESNIAAQWANAMGSSNGFSYPVDPKQAKTQMQNHPDGSRFIVSGWNDDTGTGHVWNAELGFDKRGWPTLYEVDGQIGEGRVSHLDSGDWDEVTWIRVDDKAPRDSLIQGDPSADVKPWVEG